MISKGDKSTDYRQQLSQRIIETATKMFFSRGIKAVKMDDVAARLAISKRTLYEIFNNKEKLLLHCVKKLKNEKDEHFKQFMKGQKRTEIDAIIEFYRFQMNRTASISPHFVSDLHRYPSVVSWMNEVRRTSDRIAQDFFQKGVDNGYFRKEVNFDLIWKFADVAMSNAIQSGIVEKYGVQQVFKNVTMLYVRGFCTLKGIEALEKMI